MWSQHFVGMWSPANGPNDMRIICANKSFNCEICISENEELHEFDTRRISVLPLCEQQLSRNIKSIGSCSLVTSKLNGMDFGCSRSEEGVWGPETETTKSNFPSSQHAAVQQFRRHLSVTLLTRAIYSTVYSTLYCSTGKHCDNGKIVENIKINLWKWCADEIPIFVWLVCMCVMVAAIRFPFHSHSMTNIVVHGRW